MNSTHEPVIEDIVNELHRMRHEHAKSFNFDLNLIYQDIKRREAAEERSKSKQYNLAPTDTPCRIAEDAIEYQKPQSE